MFFQTLCVCVCVWGGGGGGGGTGRSVVSTELNVSDDRKIFH